VVKCEGFKPSVEAIHRAGHFDPDLHAMLRLESIDFFIKLSPWSYFTQRGKL